MENVSPGMLPFTTLRNEIRCVHLRLCRVRNISQSSEEWKMPQLKTLLHFRRACKRK